MYERVIILISFPILMICSVTRYEIPTLNSEICEKAPIPTFTFETLIEKINEIELGLGEKWLYSFVYSILEKSVMFIKWADQGFTIMEKRFHITAQLAVKVSIESEILI